MLRGFNQGARYLSINMHHVFAPKKYLYHPLNRLNPKIRNIGAFNHMGGYNTFSSTNGNNRFGDMYGQGAESDTAKLLKKEYKEKRMRGRIGGGRSSSSGYSSGP